MSGFFFQPVMLPPCFQELKTDSSHRVHPDLFGFFPSTPFSLWLLWFVAVLRGGMWGEKWVLTSWHRLFDCCFCFPDEG